VGFNGYPHGVSNSTDLLNNDFHSSSLGLILDAQLDVQSPLLLRGVE
jgi:hypothetical protein